MFPIDVFASDVDKTNYSMVSDITVVCSTQQSTKTYHIVKRVNISPFSPPLETIFCIFDWIFTMIYKWNYSMFSEYTYILFIPGRLHRLKNRRKCNRLLFQ